MRHKVNNQTQMPQSLPSNYLTARVEDQHGDLDTVENSLDQMSEFDGALHVTSVTKDLRQNMSVFSGSVTARTTHNSTMVNTGPA